ncbi:Si-specific NAD(P)(+) transhydrogenase [Gemmata sp. JC673]|uniref:Soluble pyridine nucleotide transhydrogenase n=1 Tax=Gemmata algarum TaxID=2975278 RepID=A0ABU5F430_9BACT|nr:Si-specific NAD(P)(+) transhydrogenase [Gemmata algarum]MDY3561893.1 Si-specific NAD(P)(+) transhydrogenase [Gemmata algarum]
MSEPEMFDLVVVGAGPAGLHAALSAAALFGKRAAVVERDATVGGATTVTGTLPSKTLRETALALSGYRARKLYGVDLSLRRRATVSELLSHERTVKAAEQAQFRGLLERFGVPLVRGAATFADPHTVRVARPDGGETFLRGGAVVLATGSVPVRPPLFPFDDPRVHDSDELVDLAEIPESLAVIGAGVIGAEYACMFAALGVKTTLIDGRSKLLEFLDPDVSAALANAMTGLGVEFVWDERVTGCAAPPGGDVTLTLSSGRTLAADHVLVCAGRVSRADELNLAAAGVEPGSKGRLKVNEHFQTNVPHVYAVGDVIGFPALASTSAEQGRAAAAHALGATGLAGMTPLLPTGIYTIPEVASAGATEAELKLKGVPYVVGRADYAKNPRGKIVGDEGGFLKLLFREPDLALVGVHMIGELATELVHTGMMVMRAGGGMDLILNTCFNYPTLGGLFKQAAYAALLARGAEAHR